MKTLQVFTGYDVTEFEQLFKEKPVEWITTAGVDGLIEPIEKRADFDLSDDDFKAFATWYLTFVGNDDFFVFSTTANQYIHVIR